MSKLRHLARLEMNLYRLELIGRENGASLLKVFFRQKFRFQIEGGSALLIAATHKQYCKKDPARAEAYLAGVEAGLAHVMLTGKPVDVSIYKPK